MTPSQKTLTIPLAIIVAMMAWALYPHNPYGYYVLLRLVSCLLLVVMFFLHIAMIKFKRPVQYPAELIGWLGIFLLLAVLFNPIIQVHLTREIWTFLNLATIALLGAFWYSKVRVFEGVLIFYDNPPVTPTPIKETSDLEAARALFSEANNLFDAGKVGESTKILDQINDRYGKIKNLDIERLVGRALFCKALNLTKLNRKEEASKYYLAFIEKYEKLKLEPFVELVKMAREAISRIQPSN